MNSAEFRELVNGEGCEGWFYNFFVSMNLSDEGDCSQHVTMYFLGKQMGNKQETKDKNQPFSRCFCQDSAKTGKSYKKENPQ